MSVNSVKSFLKRGLKTRTVLAVMNKRSNFEIRARS